ncbi:MAG: hypothetical protein PHU71_03565 [Candidatus Gracilibacteria bacterium]|nr:hypothetical protein [Candidatus Gracilibacteria bacterium]
MKPIVFTLFGASGDLAKLKLFPAIYELALRKNLPQDFYLLGFARSKISDQKFREDFKQSVQAKFKVNGKILKKILAHTYYFQGDYDQKADFQKLKDYQKKLTGSSKFSQIAYFSVPPTAFQSIIKNLGETKLASDDLKIVLEKPFGTDLKSATELFHFTSTYFTEDQIFLLDHYLGKSAVQSVLGLRHHNRLLNLLMKGPEVANIQISAFESLGVDKRVGYFEQVGTLKDMVQSHLLQVLALITMSIPLSENDNSLHREKNNILSALKFYPKKNNLVLGQYEHYTKKEGVLKDSKTDTFAALRLFIDRESWYQVPIYIRTGKKLNKRHSYIVIELKKFAFQSEKEEANRIIIEFAPEEKISIKLLNKHGRSTEYQELTTSDSIACQGESCMSEHSALILDILNNKKTYFLSFPEILASWKLIDSITGFIKNTKLKPVIYSQDSCGPQQQYKLPEMDGYKWYKHGTTIDH